MPVKLIMNILRRGNLVTTNEAMVPLIKPQQFWETIYVSSQTLALRCCFWSIKYKKGRLTIDSRLGESGIESHHSQDGREIIGKQGVATPLGKQAQHGCNQYTFPHTSRSNHIHPGLFGIFKFDLDGGFDLCHLGSNENRISVPLSMVFHENVKCFVISVLADQISRRFWEETKCLSKFYYLDDLVTYKTKTIWKIDGKSCNREGILHAHSLVSSAVFKAIADATMAPIK